MSNREKIILGVIMVLLIVFMVKEAKADTKFLIGVNTTHYLHNLELNNNNRIIALERNNLTLMSMVNSNSKDSIGVIYSEKIGIMKYGIGAFSGYNGFKEVWMNDRKLWDNILINDDILIIPMLIYEKPVGDLSINIIFIPTNISILLGIKIN